MAAESVGPWAPVGEELCWPGLGLPLIMGKKRLHQAPGACVGGGTASPACWEPRCHQKLWAVGTGGLAGGQNHEIPT